MRRVKCRDCEFRGENVMTSLQHQDVFRFSYCGRDPVNLVLIEPDIPRACRWFRRRLVTVECPVCHEKIVVAEPGDGDRRGIGGGHA